MDRDGTMRSLLICCSLFQKWVQWQNNTIFNAREFFTTAIKAVAGSGMCVVFWCPDRIGLKFYLAAKMREGNWTVAERSPCAVQMVSTINWGGGPLAISWCGRWYFGRGSQAILEVNGTRVLEMVNTENVEINAASNVFIGAYRVAISFVLRWG